MSARLWGPLQCRGQVRGRSGRDGRQNYIVHVLWDFPKTRVPYLGVQIIRILRFRVLYLGSPIFGKPPDVPAEILSFADTGHVR